VIHLPSSVALHISPHAHIPADPHASSLDPTDRPQGLIGTAPSQELLDTWNKRERGLIAAHPGVVPDVAKPPEVAGAYVGQDLPDAVRKKIYEEGARTIPAREHGGNVDIKVGRTRCGC